MICNLYYLTMSIITKRINWKSIFKNTKCIISLKYIVDIMMEATSIFNSVWCVYFSNIYVATFIVIKMFHYLQQNIDVLDVHLIFPSNSCDIWIKNKTEQKFQYENQTWFHPTWFSHRDHDEQPVSVKIKQFIPSSKNFGLHFSRTLGSPR